ncbi:MAG: class II aldolase/adducin family protein [Saprospiraceae bacterium]
MDEGYIKFKAIWKKTPSLPNHQIQNINYWRQVMYKHQLIGAYEDGIGFGNISERLLDTNHFVISGSATGNFSMLTNEHFSVVTEAQIEENTLYCNGSIIASSESMSHAVIFQSLDWVNGVIHIHNEKLWKKLLYQIPTTPANISYGTPEMADAIIDLIENTNLPQSKIFVMAGHREGIFAFGRDLKAAADVILEYFK